MALTIGTKAPDFTLKTKTPSGFVDVRLSDNTGQHHTVLLFFPGAFTSPCTTEMCDATGGLPAFRDLGAQVLGISCDSAFAQEAWAKSNGIQVTLLSDYRHAVTEAYDVVLPDFVGLGPACKRAVVLIDKNGIVRYTEETPTPSELPDFEALRRALHSLG